MQAAVELDFQPLRKPKKLEYADTHRAIVEQCQQGKRQAQFELYRLYSRAMYNICLRMVRDEMDAEDLLQRSFMDVFQNLKSFKYQSSIGAWIKRIVVNNCINHLKKNRLQIEELKSYHSDRAEEEFDLNNYQYSVEEVKLALNNLPDGYRVVFSLYLLEGYDHKEIAEILSISEATSKSQFSRAKKKLKDMLLENGSLQQNY